MKYAQVASLAAASLGAAFASGYSFANNHHTPNPNAKYTDSGKPMSKRRKRRLRAKTGASA